MSKWILRRDMMYGGGYVKPPGQSKSYTPYRHLARRFDTKEEAEANKCGNEFAVEDRDGDT